MYADQIAEARGLATPVVQNITAVDTCPAMVVQYVSVLGTGGATAGVSKAAGEGDITFSVDSAVAAGLDLVGTLGVVLPAAVTMGELVDEINRTAAWRAYLVGAIRSDDPTCLLAHTGETCHGDNGDTLYFDSSATPVSNQSHMSIAISGEKFVNAGVNGHVTDYNDGCENSLLYGSFTATFASASGTSSTQDLKYYSGRQGETEVQIGSDVTMTDATAKEQGESGLIEPFVQATRGSRLIARLVSASLSSALSAPTINIIGKTAVLKNDRMVTEINYGE